MTVQTLFESFQSFSFLSTEVFNGIESALSQILLFELYILILSTYIAYVVYSN